MNYSWLPKLSLPTFDGNPLEWQIFWDSFSAAVDSHSNLTGVQKFNYLRTQLQGDVLCVISGFPLSNNNYSHSVELLKERFSQKHKLVEAHIDTLLKVSPPPTIKLACKHFMTHWRVTSEHYQHWVSHPNHVDPFWPPLLWGNSLLLWRWIYPVITIMLSGQLMNC